MIWKILDFLPSLSPVNRKPNGKINCQGILVFWNSLFSFSLIFFLHSVRIKNENNDKSANNSFKRDVICFWRHDGDFHYRKRERETIKTPLFMTPITVFEFQMWASSYLRLISVTFLLRREKK